MNWRLLPVEEQARREAEDILQAASGLAVLFFIAAGLVVPFAVNRENVAPCLMVIGGELVIATAAWLNSRSGYTVCSAGAQLLIGIVAIGAGITTAVHFAGSTTAITPAIYVLLITMMTVYMSPAAGAVSLGVTVASYGALQYLEQTGVLPYSPFYPAKSEFVHIPGYGAETFVELTFIASATYVTALYIARALRRRKEEAEAANTELTETNARLVALDELKNRFLSVVSHDLRTPITSIKVYAELVEEHTEGEDRKFLRTISAEAERLNRLVTDLLDLDKMEAGKMEWRLSRQDIRPILTNATEVFRAAAEERRVHLTEEISTELPVLAVDADRLSQLVANLLSNAIKFTPAGGAVTVSASAIDGAVHLAVADTGPGIPPDDLERIFDRFSQTETGKKEGAGTGLGLAIVKEIAAGHGGTVSVDSAVGQGTTFTVTLPLGETPQA